MQPSISGDNIDIEKNIELHNKIAKKYEAHHTER